MYFPILEGMNEKLNHELDFYVNNARWHIIKEFLAWTWHICIGSIHFTTQSCLNFKKLFLEIVKNCAWVTTHINGIVPQKWPTPGRVFDHLWPAQKRFFDFYVNQRICLLSVFILPSDYTFKQTQSSHFSIAHSFVWKTKMIQPWHGLTV